MDKHLDLIGNLLRKAERTDNEHEAEAFLAAAQKLASRHSVDLAVARAHTAKQEKRETPENRTVVIGQKGKHGNVQYVQLFSAIARANDVEIFIAHDSTRVYPMGFPSDLDVVEALYASLVVQMVTAGDRYVKSGEYKSEKTMRQVRRKAPWGTYTDWEEKSVDGRTARRSFYNGYISRIAKRLKEVKEAAEAEAVAQDEAIVPTNAGREVITTAIALREKKSEVATFVENEKRRQGVRGSWRGGRASAGSSSRAHNAGDRAARHASLNGRQAIGA